jgi:hypothetical protein
MSLYQQRSSYLLTAWLNIPLIFAPLYERYKEPGWRSRYSDLLQVGGLRGRTLIPSRFKNFLSIVQTGSGVDPVFYTMYKGGYILGVKRPGREVDHSPPTSAEFKKM